MPPLPVPAAIPFPGRAIKAGESRPDVVIALQRQLNTVGCGPVAEDGKFGAATTMAVKRFQMRFPDVDGQPLKVDGVVGPVTWAALFGAESTVVTTESPLGKAAIEAARREVGVREVPPGSNRGPRVDEYLRSVAIDPSAGSFPWCAAFVYFCFDMAAREEGRPNPLVKTGGVLAHWNKAGQQGAKRITATEAATEPSLVEPGQIFVMDFGKGVGHTGLIAEVRSGKLVTIEGNTNDGGGREGIGVFERTGRKISSVNKGFISYGGV